MASHLVKAGEVAEQAGVGVQTLHFYERSGLLPKPKRSAANYRLYSPEFVRRVQFIKKAQAFGFTLEEIRDILDLKDHGKAPCRRVAQIAGERLREIEAELAKWRGFRRALGAALPQWERETAVQRVCAGEFCDLIERLK
jgi:DNA-binding transcriptional MerR regulator